MEKTSRTRTYEDRREAAERLLPLLEDLKSEHPLVMAIPRGAVPMAKLIADSLNAPLDLALAKKIGHPLYPEFAIGAVSETGEIVISTPLYDVDAELLETRAVKIIETLLRQRSQYTGFERYHYPQGRTVILVDDGIATGLTMLAAVRSLKSLGAKKIVVAAPVASREAVERLRLEGVETRIDYIPQEFGSVSYFYKSFEQVSDSEVGAYFQIRTREIEIEDTHRKVKLKAVIGQPAAPVGIVVFAHGGGSGRMSPSQQFVADVFNRQGLVTVLADLLSEDEAQDRSRTFDIELLGERTALLVEWAKQNLPDRQLPLGILGAGTGAAAALQAAVKRPELVEALVLRGGRPDLAEETLKSLRCPVLFLVGEKDQGVLELNQDAYRKVQTTKSFEVIPQATHLFEEPGALERVADKALRWFLRFFARERLLNSLTDPPLFP
ncbi:MAG: phosphoribosyltransferase family protein [Bdellovibrionales bacterium]